MRAECQRLLEFIDLNERNVLEISGQFPAPCCSQTIGLWPTQNLIFAVMYSQNPTISSLQSKSSNICSGRIVLRETFVICSMTVGIF